MLNRPTDDILKIKRPQNDRVGEPKLRKPEKGPAPTSVAGSVVSSAAATGSAMPNDTGRNAAGLSPARNSPFASSMITEEPEAPEGKNIPRESETMDFVQSGSFIFHRLDLTHVQFRRKIKI